eukprot:scaffold149404_cov36-Prasinocladus_malaysianus.AAC.1
MSRRRSLTWCKKLLTITLALAVICFGIDCRRSSARLIGRPRFVHFDASKNKTATTHGAAPLGVANRGRKLRQYGVFGQANQPSGPRNRYLGDYYDDDDDDDGRVWFQGGASGGVQR